MNNAGFGVVGPVERLPIDEGKRMFETNFFGALRMIQAVLPQMRERGSGTIVNVSSVAGRVAPPLDGMYSGTKFALEGLTEALKLEVGHFGIKVAIVEPGFFETDVLRTTSGGSGPTPRPTTSSSGRGTRRPQRLRGGAETGPVPRRWRTTIADVVESDDPGVPAPGRRRRGDGPRRARASMDDATFEAAMRETLELDW